jgi:FkbM family methyltransferase
MNNTYKENINEGKEINESTSKINIFDIGCRWGFADRFLTDKCLKSFRIFGFDPDVEECLRLNQRYADMPSGFIMCLPIGLAGSPGMRNLYITKEPACSSLHPPIQYLVENYPALEGITLEKVISIPVTTLEIWAKKNHLNSVDYIKIDTQGTELEILKGGESLLHTTRCIDIEVEFNPIYEGQTLFWETDAYLRSKGYILWRLSNLVHYTLGAEKLKIADDNRIYYIKNSEQGSAKFGGQLFWADARYVHTDVFSKRSAESERFKLDCKLFEILEMNDIMSQIS